MNYTQGDMVTFELGSEEVGGAFWKYSSEGNSIFFIRKCGHVIDGMVKEIRV